MYRFDLQIDLCRCSVSCVSHVCVCVFCFSIGFGHQTSRWHGIIPVYCQRILYSWQYTYVYLKVTDCLLRHSLEAMGVN